MPKPNKRKPGRPPSDDPRKCLPFRLKESLIKKAVKNGREWLESLIEKGK